MLCLSCLKLWSLLPASIFCHFFLLLAPMQGRPNQDQILSGCLLIHCQAKYLCRVIGNTSGRCIQERRGCQDTMHLTGPGGRVIGKNWFLQNQVKIGCQDITARGEDGYQGTGDKQKKGATRAEKIYKDP